MQNSAACKFVGIGFAALVLFGCKSSGPLVVDRLDPVTAVTATRTTEPLIFYRTDSSATARAREFISVGPVEINRQGHFSYSLWLGIWQSSRGKSASPHGESFDSVVFFVDGERMPLEWKGLSEELIGLSEPVYPEPISAAVDAYFIITVDQIRLLAYATEIRLQVGEASFEPWEKLSRATLGLRAFVDHVAQ